MPRRSRSPPQRGGSQPGMVYEFSYLTALTPVVGSGMLAVRDAAEHFGADAEATFGFGISQTGRFLRQFLHDGMNRTDAGRAAFDGLLPHVAGARRGEFNHLFAQPSAQHHVGPGHQPPYATADLLRRAGAPVKVIETNTSSEYWRSDCSWTHSEHPDLRQYLFAGTMHAPGLPILTDMPPDPTGVRGANPRNTVDYLPLLRAALINLEAWVCEGVKPPPSAVPNPGCDRESVLEVFEGLAGAIRLDPLLLPRLPGAVAPVLVGSGYGRQRDRWHLLAGSNSPTGHAHGLEPAPSVCGRSGAGGRYAGLDPTVSAHLLTP